MAASIILIIQKSNNGQFRPAPVREPPLADERCWCRFALHGDLAGAAHCPERRQRPDGARWCALDGFERQAPCVFDELPGAPIWHDIADYRAECAEKGWPL